MTHSRQLTVEFLAALEERARWRLRQVDLPSTGEPGWGDSHDAAAMLALIAEVREARISLGIVAGQIQHFDRVRGEMDVLRKALAIACKGLVGQP